MNPIKSIFALLILIASGCATVGPGQVGVLWRVSSGTQAAVYGEGLYPVARWNKMYVYDLKSKNQDEILSAITINGLSITLGTSLRYSLLPRDIVGMHQQIGQNYYQTFVKPTLLSAARRILAQYTPEQIYVTKRAGIEREVREAISAFTGGRYVLIEAFLIREVELPLLVRAAIDLKLATEQKVLQMQHNLALARAAAELKQVEAMALAAYNNTVRGSLSLPLIEYERVMGLGQVARSPNAKTVVIGPTTVPSPVLIETQR
jgi:regulator of protease activity HflC (stomatin/prohibitin superfamily)